MEIKNVIIKCITCEDVVFAQEFIFKNDSKVKWKNYENNMEQTKIKLGRLMSAKVQLKDLIYRIDKARDALEKNEYSVKEYTSVKRCALDTKNVLTEFNKPL